MVGIGVAVVAFLQGLAGTVPVAAAAPCPNEAIRQAQGATGLPDCMALEMVSPPRKYVQAAFRPSFSANGERVLFRSQAGLAQTPGLQSYKGDSYVATRSSSGWTVAPTSPPASAQLAAGGGTFGGPNAFDSDLSHWSLFGSTQQQNAVAISRFYRSGLDGSFSPLSPLLVPIDNSGDPRIVFYVTNTDIKGASADLSTTLFGFDSQLPFTIIYLPGDPSMELGVNPGGDRNLYLVTDSGGTPSLELLARDGLGQVWGNNCGTHLGGGVDRPQFGNGGIVQGALSRDGARIYFSTRPAQPEAAECSPATNPLRILARTRTPAGPVISELVPGGPSQGSDLYQGASVDGSKVYFTTTRSLVAGDQDVPAPGAECSRQPGASASCDLYLYDADLASGERLIQVSAGDSGAPTPGKNARVLSSITAVSGDGSHVYFVAEKALTPAPNPEGSIPANGKPNLYLYERDSTNPDGRIAFVGTLSPDDEGELWGVERSYFGGAYSVPVDGEDGGAEVGGDGHVLLFASRAQLTAGDSDAGGRDVFRYDASAETLQRLSSAADGGSELASADAVVNINNRAGALSNAAGEGRWVSEDGNTVTFLTTDPLVSSDGDEETDAYVWANGRIGQVPGVVAEPPTTSGDGGEVAFNTVTPLLPQDGDTANDAYVARSAGGFPFPVETAPCNPLSGACQGPLAIPPAAQVPATSVLSDPGNVKPKKKAKKKRHKKKGQKKSHNRRGVQR